MLYTVWSVNDGLSWNLLETCRKLAGNLRGRFILLKTCRKPTRDFRGYFQRFPEVSGKSFIDGPYSISYSVLFSVFAKKNGRVGRGRGNVPSVPSPPFPPVLPVLALKPKKVSQASLILQSNSLLPNKRVQLAYWRSASFLKVSFSRPNPDIKVLLYLYVKIQIWIDFLRGDILKVS